MMILVVVGIASLSSEEATIENTHWVFGEGHGNGMDINVYLGLTHVTGSVNSFTIDYDWDSDNCISDECNDCADASHACRATVIMAFVTEIPAITTKLTRSHVDSDTNCQKWMGIITTFISMLSTLITLSTFADLCYRNLSDEYRGIKMTYTWGPGMVCILLATVLKVIDIVIHCAVPVANTQTKGPTANTEKGESVL
jgi:hypothetical protein